MADADLLFRAGDLDGARSALVDKVKSAPADQPARLFLFQLLCLTGEWERARTQLRALASLSPEAQMLSVTYDQAIDAELFRAAVFRGEEAPVTLAGSAPWAGELAAALGMAARGEPEAAARRDAALEAAPDTPGELDGVEFDWIADVDPRFGPAFEAVLYGRWTLVPFEQVERISTEGPKDLRDTVWLPAQIWFRSGQSANAMLPVRYPGSEDSAAPSSARLARSTEWREEPWGDAGVGQRLWMLSGGEEVDLLSVRELRFRVTGG